jgi:hypothetical protein
VPKSVLRPLLALNAVYLVLATLGPHYGWTVMILVGAVVSALTLRWDGCSDYARRNRPR